MGVYMDGDLWIYKTVIVYNRLQWFLGGVRPFVGVLFLFFV